MGLSQKQPDHTHRDGMNWLCRRPAGHWWEGRRSGSPETCPAGGRSASQTGYPSPPRGSACRNKNFLDFISWKVFNVRSYDTASAAKLTWGLRIPETQTIGTCCPRWWWSAGDPRASLWRCLEMRNPPPPECNTNTQELINADAEMGKPITGELKKTSSTFLFLDSIRAALHESWFIISLFYVWSVPF